MRRIICESRQVGDEGEMAVPSPCTNICQLDPATGYCLGCLRTIEEIAAWGAADERWKLAVLEKLNRRSITKERG